MIQALNNETPVIAQGPRQNDADEIKVDDKTDKTKSNVNQLEAALAKSYYTKVKSRCSQNSSISNKFVQFREMLKTFDPHTESPVDLYRKVEELFGAEHKDVVEEFLLFLKPGQAAEVGRFMDHFMLNQMTSFIDLLQVTFSRKIPVYRKILRAITSGMNSGNSQDMKARVLPHLRSNPRLTLMFKSMFPDERPPDSAYEGGVDIVDESFLECDRGFDVWEFAEDKVKKKTEVKEGLDSVYLHGRVFIQHGRILKPACVTYPYSKEPYRVHSRRLAPNIILNTHQPEEENSSKRSCKPILKLPTKKSRKQTTSPTKNVKDVNDNKKDFKQAINKVKGKLNSKTKCKNDEIVKKKDRIDMKSVCQKKNECKVKKDIRNDRSWTRDEDKTILEVLKGEGGFDKALVRVCKLLPHRSQTEVKERFCHVMNLLQQMAVNEVT
ncbi:unnamed protein product [Leptidea sinapis]|uniref:Myb-like domain-containing protein n=1 Tax=Leptidea sinapis TaxID=189913 RepID=A0A5E4Q5D5_9NEOP|nr:unnamed protein product [Leptidea sinapis]